MLSNGFGADAWDVVAPHLPSGEHLSQGRLSPQTGLGHGRTQCGKSSAAIVFPLFSTAAAATSIPGIRSIRTTLLTIGVWESSSQKELRR